MRASYRTSHRLPEREFAKTVWKPIPPSRSGQTLILFVFMMIALVGVLALTLDFGFVLHARRQMQTGVNAAALEGLRDLGGNGREDARDLMRIIYDDDLDPDQNETTIGAGIDKSLIQGEGYRSVTIGDGSGLRNIIANRSQYIYRPNPQLNNDNEVHGDFVRGVFDPSREHGELQTYQRDDFEPNPTGNAFLARLRRTHNPNGFDQVPNVSSSGGGLPLIIGHLAWFSATNPTDRYSIRRDGVTVRATAIADQKPVVSVGESRDIRVFNAIAFAFDLDLNAWYSIASEKHALGQIVDVVPGGPIEEPVETGYAPLVANFGVNKHIVGFRLLNPSANRAINASSRLHDVWPQLSELDEVTRLAILNRFQVLVNSTAANLATVPALVRSIR